MYTNIIPFSRYDVLLYELGRLKLTDITGDTHVLDKTYRSYNTYRKNIGHDSLSLKINETYNDQDKVEENFFDISTLETNYVFDGIVLSKQYATNGNEMSLEDLFAEYYYNYLKAVDSSYLYNPEYASTYYFSQSYIDLNTGDEITGGTYNILPIGSLFVNDDQEVETVLYDGTYVPTIGELLSGLLYIVIQSEGKPARKVMFNNLTLPTLFINDDKYYTIDEYIMNDAQLMRLCDVKLYAKLGCKIAWEKLVYIDGLSNMNMLLNILNASEGADPNTPFLLDEEGKISKDYVFYRIYYKAYYKNSVSPEEVHFVSGISQISINDIPSNFGNGLVNKPDNGISWVWTNENLLVYQDKVYLMNEDRDFLYRNSGYIPASNVDVHTITLNILFAISLILKSFTLTESTDEYTLEWYEYSDDEPTRSIYWFTVTN